MCTSIPARLHPLALVFISFIVFGSYLMTSNGCDVVQLFKDKRSYDYKSVRRWTTQKKIGYSLADCDKVRALNWPQHKVAGG